MALEVLEKGRPERSERSMVLWDREERVDAEIPDKADEDRAQNAPKSCGNNATTGYWLRTREIGGVRGEFVHCDSSSGGILGVVVVVKRVVRELELKLRRIPLLTPPPPLLLLPLQRHIVSFEVAFVVHLFSSTSSSSLLSFSLFLLS